MTAKKSAQKSKPEEPTKWMANIGWRADNHPYRDHVPSGTKRQICKLGVTHLDAWLVYCVRFDKIVLRVERREAGRHLQQVTLGMYYGQHGFGGYPSASPLEGPNVQLGSPWMNRPAHARYKAEALKLHEFMREQIAMFRAIPNAYPPSVFLHYIDQSRAYVDPFAGLGPNQWAESEQATHSERMLAYHANKRRLENRAKRAARVPGNQGGWKGNELRLDRKGRSIMRTLDKLLGLYKYD